MKLEQFEYSKGLVSVFPKTLYMESDLTELHMPIAMDLTINTKDKTAGWGDTLRGHSIHYSSFTFSDEEICITDTDKTQWRFVPLTLSIFNEKARRYLTPIGDFASDDALQAYYRDTLFYP